MSKAYAFTAYGGPEVESFVDLPRPALEPGQLLIRVRAAGVNPSDWKRRSGLFARPPFTEPIVLGSEAAGVVEEVAGDGDGFAVGDAVFGYPTTGGYAQYTVFPAELTARKPPSVSFTDAATLPVAAATAFDGVDNLDLPPGATILITGVGGGVGTAAAQIARYRGLTVVGTAGPAKHEFLRSIGVTPVAYGDGVADRVREVAPQGVDGIYDLIGGASLEAVAVLLKDPAKLVTANDPATATRLGGAMIRRDRGRRVLEEVATLVAEGHLKPFVTTTYPLDQAPEALREVEDGHASGKIVIEVPE
jgi:NADPH:quinone reductase-like Zn-dependent oxidoreductase